MPTVMRRATVQVPAWLRGLFRLADPKITLASAASMVVGLAAAAYHGPLNGLLLVLTVIGIFCLEAAKNASGEVFDFDSGADLGVEAQDRSPFSGGKRVIVDGLLTPRQTWVAALAFYATGGAAGLLLVLWSDARVLWLGLIGVTLAFFYHAPPIKLSYRGFGELAVALTYGPLIAMGTYLVQRHDISNSVVWLSVPVGLLVGAFLWINEFPDYCADAAAGKRTLVVRLGRYRASRVFVGLVVAAFGLVALLPLVGLPPTVVLGLVGLPHAIFAARRLLRHYGTTSEIIAAQKWTLLSFVLLALGLAMGLLVVRPAF